MATTDGLARAVSSNALDLVQPTHRRNRRVARDTIAAWSCRVSCRCGRMSLTTKARKDGAELSPGWRGRSAPSAGAA